MKYTFISYLMTGGDIGGWVELLRESYNPSGMIIEESASRIQQLHEISRAEGYSGRINDSIKRHNDILN
jgi:hypothetical protein